MNMKPFDLELAKIAANSTPDKYIKTIKIEWEE